MLELWPENIGPILTFAVGDSSLVVDAIFARLLRGSSIRNWQVRPDLYSDSEHWYLLFALMYAFPYPSYQPPSIWARRKLDMTRLECDLKADAKAATPSTGESNLNFADSAVADLQSYLERICNEAIPCRGRINRQR